MSIEGFYKEHYQEVRKRIMNVKPYVKPIIDHQEQKDKPRWEIIQEHKMAMAEESKRLIKEAVLRYALAVTPSQVIIRRVAEEHGVTFKDIVGTSRVRKIVAARFEAIKEVRVAFPEKSLPEIGRIFNKDHTSVINSLRKTGCWTVKD